MPEPKWIVKIEVETISPGHASEIIHRLVDIAMANPQVKLEFIVEFVKGSEE